MPWRNFLIAVALPLATLLSIYGTAVALGFLGYWMQLTALTRLPWRLALQILRPRLARLAWPVVGALGVVYGGTVFMGCVAVLTFVVAPPNTINAASGVGGVIAVLVYVDGLRFVARPVARRGRSITEYETPEVLRAVNMRRRARIGLQVYWYAKMRGMATYVLLISAIVILARVSLLSDDPAPGVGPGLIVGWMLIFPAYFLLLNWVPGWMMPAARAILGLSVIAREADDKVAYNSPTNAGNDPLDWCRWQLRRVALDLERQARRLDRLMGSTELHPVGSVLRATAQHLRTFVTSEGSLVRRLPGEIRSVIDGALLVLAGTARKEPYRNLAVAVAAFDSAGRPVIQSSTRFRLSAWGNVLARAAEGSDALRRVLVLAVVLAIIVSYLAGWLNPDEVAQLRP